MFKKLILLLCLLTIGLQAQYERPGSTAGQFLKIGVSPRGTAMGDAFISVVEGAEGTFYNAAAPTWQSGTDIVFNHTVWFAGMNHDFAAITHNFGDMGTLGLSVIGLYTDEMIVRTPLQPDGTGETFYSSNYKVGLTYSRFFTDKVSVGFTVGLINESLYQEFSETVISLDIAAMYVSDFRDFTFAMQISNFGQSIQFVHEIYPLPTAFTFGAKINAIDMETQKVAVAFSTTKPNDGAPQTNIGMEYNFNDMFYARGGYYLSHSTAKYSFGGGVQYGIGGYDLRFDYSYNDFSLLGVSHRFGVGFNLK